MMHWTCGFCGNIHADDVTKCNCGHILLLEDSETKPTNDDWWFKFNIKTDNELGGIIGPDDGC